MKKRMLLAAAIAAVALLFHPTHVFACDDWSIACLSGVTDIADRDAQRRENEAKTTADHDLQVAQVRESAEVAKKNADIAIQAQVQAKEITVEQGRQLGENYRKLVDSQSKEKITAIMGATFSNVATIEGTTKIALAGITESGQTVRQRLLLETVQSLIKLVVTTVTGLILLIIVLVVVRFIRSNSASVQRKTNHAQTKQAAEAPEQEEESEFYAIDTISR